MACAKQELLAPAGGPEQLNAALAAGADAVYCGLGHHFNARRGATGFDDESFAQACRLAHLAGVRVYVTVNVVVRTDEMPRALALVRRAWLLGADAFIIQDWGLLEEVRLRWPQMEVHISTQANVHDARGVRWCAQRWGVERVTLSREVSLPEMRQISQEGVELEGFCHGALCICYSGVCQMSSLAGGRSANRGACAQPCRLPYELVDEWGERLEGSIVGRPLCPKDYRTMERLGELAEAGIASLKVEGRLKGADYVHSVVRAYRAALDEEGGRETALTQSERDRLLRRAFNRDFTDGYLDGVSGDSLMSYERSNNRGELVGTVVASRDLGSTRVWRGGSNGGRERTRKKHLAEVDVLLEAPVGKGDLLEVRPVNDPSQFLTSLAEADAEAGEVLTCRTARPMEKGCPVRVIRSQQALDVAARVGRSQVPRRRPVNVHVVARRGRPFRVELSCADGTHSAYAEGFRVVAARTRPVTKEDVATHVGRMGGSPFEPVSIEVELDEGCGMRFSDIHEVRTAAGRALVKEILASYEQREAAKAPSEARISRDLLGRGLRAEATADLPETVDVCALVTSPEMARHALRAGATRLYATPDDLQSHEWPADLRPYPWLDEVCREIDHDRLDPYAVSGAPLAVGSVSELALAVERGAFAEVRECIPVHNTSALLALEAAGACGFWLSCELTLAEIASLAPRATVPVGAFVYGRARAMTTEHCVLQAAGRCVDNCRVCTVRRERVSLCNDHGDEFPVRTDLQGRSRVYAARPLDACPEVGVLVKAGVRRLMVDGTLLRPQELERAVLRVGSALHSAFFGQEPPERLEGHTAGRLYEGIS